MRTADGGVTWDPVGTPIVAADRPNFWDMSFVDEQTGWVVGEDVSVPGRRPFGGRCSVALRLTRASTLRGEEVGGRARVLLQLSEQLVGGHRRHDRAC